MHWNFSIKLRRVSVRKYKIDLIWCEINALLTTYTVADKLSRMGFALTVLLTLSLICTQRIGMDDSLAK